MSGETAKPKTCVFWDVDDRPILNGLDPNLIYYNIKSALVNQGYDGDFEFKAYGEKKTFSNARMTFVPKVTKHSRKMLFDILLWALDNPAKPNLLLISKTISEDDQLVTALECFSELGFSVLLAQPDCCNGCEK